MSARILARLLLSATFAALVAAMPLGAQVQVNLHTGDPEWASAILDNAPPGLYEMRGYTDGMLRDIQCSGLDSIESLDGALSVHHCGALSWQFRLLKYSTQGTLASNQLNWLDENHGWWLISGGQSILRPPLPEFSTAIEFRLDGQALQVLAGAPRLSRLYEAPEFWLLGSAEFADKGPVRHFFDRRPVPEHLIGMLDVYTEAIQFLSDRLAVTKLPPVFWMGIDNWQLGTGGAAGNGLILANYPNGAEDFDVSSRAITLYTVLHEHAHVAFDAEGVLWIAESVASYLALKAVKQAVPHLYTVLESAFIEPASAHESTLPMLGKRAAAGDIQAYGQLYEGAAFWIALEAVMANHNPSEEFLSHLPRLLKEGFGPDGATNKRRLAKLMGSPHSELSPVLDQYLGRN